MYCQRNFMLYVINYVIFLEIKIENSPLFLQSIFYPVQYTYHIMLIGNFASEVYLPHALVSIQIHCMYVLYKLRFTLECMKYNCPSS